ncbi:16S rRNA (cytidine(1402)-2'-O)-methyltransferase [Tunturibacter psychrotolerans]|jgi:16S rRNA (cytidine1402-2'-O)-methyltransferase|uniref:Ribosomal RNA small subunit methyltransferase I n=2 Tax=Tunturiibacter TaxID=3154218 RepID=A0AAU7ZNM8_9BACT|nr:16S rRNA (cytidine(1402)-2'-O)-methyltransferase [Edaphobacter lichenicola]MBB5331210.1 16S rRNA (cytidine1402-2'-O)-methyltransferase [Edaphobacter lichenicola]
MSANQDKDDRPLAPGLYLVATPIGNLEDITLRALRVLRQADRIGCEDTRQTQKLLNHFEIRTPTVSYHMHNEGSRTEELIAELKNGARIAIVSDAGTPGIADPGGQIVAAALTAGVDVFPIPGANAAISGVIASGLTTERFTFHGFLPAKAGQRKTALEELARDDGTHIFYEAPHRILDTLADVEAVFGPEQHVVIARELTKIHEEFLRGSAAGIRSQLASRASVRGEIVLMLTPTPTESASEDKKTTLAAEVAALMKSEAISEMDALKRVARERGIGKSEAYRELQREQNRRR